MSIKLPLLVNSYSSLFWAYSFSNLIDWWFCLELASFTLFYIDVSLLADTSLLILKGVVF